MLSTAKPDSPESGFLFSRKSSPPFPFNALTAILPSTMQALAPAPAPRLAHAAGPELPPISFFGRSLTEYAQFFALDLAALKGRDVLDVAAGPSSFTAEACARKLDAVAVDPFYGAPADDLAARIERDYAHMFAQLRARPRRLSRKTYPTIDVAEFDRRSAAQRFLTDYVTHYSHNRYVGASLPRLPFFDGTFDLVLCAHLLFSHAQRFDFDWHLAACRELVRVSAGEVRIHPLCGLDGRPYAGLPRLRRELRAEGIASEVVPLDYEFLVGANAMLVMRRAAP